MKMHNLYEENFAISLVYYKLQNVNQELFIAFHASSYANHTKNQDFKKKIARPRYKTFTKVMRVCEEL